MNGCGDCRLVANGVCPHTGDRCGDPSTRRVGVVDDPTGDDDEGVGHLHEARAGRRIEIPGFDEGVPTDVCRCGAYRLWHATKPGHWREGPFPELSGVQIWRWREDELGDEY